MAVLMVGYDLHGPESRDDYKRLIEAIKKLGSDWWHCLDSTWLVVTNLTPAQVRDRLSPYLDANDTLLAVKLVTDGTWASWNFSKDCAAWLQKYL